MVSIAINQFYEIEIIQLTIPIDVFIFSILVTNGSVYGSCTTIVYSHLLPGHWLNHQATYLFLSKMGWGTNSVTMSETLCMPGVKR